MAEFNPPQAQAQLNSSSTAKAYSTSNKSAKKSNSVDKKGITESCQPEQDNFEISYIVPSFSKSLPPQLLRSYHKSLEEAKEAKEAVEVLGNSDSFLVISNVHRVNKYGQRDITTYKFNDTQVKEKSLSAGVQGPLSKDQDGFQEDSAIASSEEAGHSAIASSEEAGPTKSGNKKDHRYSSFQKHSYISKKEKHFDGKVNCTINVSKFQKSDIFVVYKKPVIKGFLDVKLSMIPNMDHDGILWHDLHIEAVLKGPLSINVRDSVTTCELATYTEVNEGNGWAHYLWHKNHKFYTGQINYYCHLIQAEHLRDCRRKDIDVRVTFELYPRDADQYNLEEEWDDDAHLMVVKNP